MTQILATPRAPFRQVKAAPSKQVMTALRTWIESGRFRDGDPLPSEREVAKHLEVARTTVRSAFGELERQGLVEQSGDRRRRIVRTTAAPSTLLSRTVAIPTEVAVGNRVGTEFPHGWDLYTYAEAVKVFQSRGLNILTLMPASLAQEQLAQLVAGRPLGLILTHEVRDPSVRQRIIEACNAQRVPLVADGDGPELAEQDRVTSDHETGCYELTRWLLASGRRRILRFRPLANPPLYWQTQRDAGYERAMHEAGIQPLPLAHFPELPSIHGHDDRGLTDDAQTRFATTIRIIAGHLIEHYANPATAPDAIVAVTDADARLIGAALRLLGRTPQRDVLVTGYDNTWADDPEKIFEPTPPAATVDKNNHLVGEALANLLIDRVGGTLQPEPQRRLVTPRLIVLLNEENDSR
jgi:DNA-binding LacI/PurR family transcriptional regulator/DNA-binding transcriptional regulator YhcF (GntR family)